MLSRLMYARMPGYWFPIYRSSRSIVHINLRRLEPKCIVSSVREQANNWWWCVRTIRCVNQRLQYAVIEVWAQWNRSALSGCAVRTQSLDNKNSVETRLWPRLHINYFSIQSEHTSPWLAPLLAEVGSPSSSFFLTTRFFFLGAVVAPPASTRRELLVYQ